MRGNGARTSDADVHSGRGLAAAVITAAALALVTTGCTPQTVSQPSSYRRRINASRVIESLMAEVLFIRDGDQFAMHSTATQHSRFVILRDA